MKSARGFTLIEVLIAIALVLALGGALFAFLHDMLSTRQRALRHAMQQRSATTLIERLETDVAATLVGNSRDGPGVRGDATSLRLQTRGVMTQLAARGLDEPGAFSDLQLIEYRFDPAARRLEARKNAATRESGDAEGQSGERAGGNAAAEMPFAALGGEVAHLRFRYLDQQQWQDSFDSLAARRLPQAIEVAVWFHPWPQDDASGAASANGEGTQRDGDSAGTKGNRSAAANFDERAHGRISDNESQRLPPPDRLRVIVIPDGGGGDDAVPTSVGEHE